LYICADKSINYLQYITIMKASLFALSVMLLPVLSHAQELKKHEIGFSFAFGGQAENHFENYCDKMNHPYPGNANYADEIEIPMLYRGFNLDYFYHIDKHWSVGASFGWAVGEDSNFDCQQLTETEEANHGNYIRSNMFHFMPTVRYDWLKVKAMRFYSSASLGVAYMKFRTKDVMTKSKLVPEDPGCYIEYDRTDNVTDRESKLVFAYQATPVGFEAGYRFRGFVELGYGYKGVFAGGVRFNF